MARLLSRWGHDVLVAYDGSQALSLAESGQPDVVLLDIGLPGLNGFQVAGRLRQMLDAKPVCIIAVTGYGQKEDREKTRQAGFDHHLVKPVDPGALKGVLLQARE